MKHLIHRLRVPLASLAAAGTVFLGVAPASASEIGGGGCDGDISYVNVADNTWYQYDLSNGVLEAEFVNGYTGIEVQYIKTGGSSINGYFYYTNYTTDVLHESGSFTESAGQTRSADWTNQGALSCVGVGMFVTGQGEFFIGLYTGN